MIGWDHPDTARRYREFEKRHDRYRLANLALARHASLRAGLKVLDCAAGTGGTSEILLSSLGATGRIDALEAASAMRNAGRARLGGEPRVRWIAGLDESRHDYDRIVCGAALWQMPDLPALIGELAPRLAPGGALVVDVPAAYLGVPDRPGGGRDPWLTELPARMVALRPRNGAPAARPQHAPLDAAGLYRAFEAAGLQVQCWRHRQRLTQPAFRDWLKIPVLTDALWPELDAPARDQLIDAAAADVDPRSWRREDWLGITAWKPLFGTAPLVAFSRRADDGGESLRDCAAKDGVVLLRGCLPREALADLKREVTHAARRRGLLDGRSRWRGGCWPALHESAAWLALQADLAQLSTFKALASHPVLTQAMAALTGQSLRGEHGSVCRIAPPETFIPATPPHRDANYIATPGLWTAWLPLADCGPLDGVLAVVPGSHVDRQDVAWAATAMRPGDVLFFGARTLHRACPNRHWSRARLSVEFRFAPEVAA